MKDRIRNILMEATVFEDRPNINDKFWKWFGDSKIVDDHGNPMPVYHGSKNTFTSFNLGKAGNNNDTGMWGTGFYFSPDKNISLAYGNNLYRVYLSIQNPLIVKGNSSLPKEFRLSPTTPTHGEAGKRYSDDMRKRLLSAGYDGVMHYESSNGGFNKLGQIVAFYPTQIKSVRNQGTWDNNYKDIMK